MAISDRQDDGHKASVEQIRSRGNLTCPSSGRKDARQDPPDRLDAEPPGLCRHPPGPVAAIRHRYNQRGWALDRSAYEHR